MTDEPMIHPTAPDSLEKVAADMAEYIKRHARNMKDGKFRVMEKEVDLGEALVKRYDNVDNAQR